MGNPFALLSIGRKIWLIVVLSVLALASLAGYALKDKYSVLEEQKRLATKHVVESAHGALVHFHALETSGKLSREQAQQQAIAAVKALRYEGSEYFWINDMQPAMIMHPIKPELDGKNLSAMADPNGKKLFVEFVDEVKRNGAGFVAYYWPKPGADRPVPKISYVKGFAPWGWVIGSGIYVDDVDAEFRSSARYFAGLLALVVLVLGIAASSLIRQTVGPLRKAIAVASAVAKGDLSSRIDVTSKDETGQLLQALNETDESLRKVVGGVRTSADAISSASHQLAAGNSDLSQRTEQQASSLEVTASSMEELTSTVKQNAENARQANQLAAGASNVAVLGGKAISQVVHTMSGISESSRKIADIISVIDGIAFQTNILALNAAVEAARAGEQGRGFAVVATEVRNLAQRSATAAKEIKDLIADSVAKVDDGTRMVDEAGKTMEEIVSSVKRVTDIIAEIATASQEQSSGIEQVNGAIAQMEQVTQQNTALVEEAAAAAESMQEQAQALAQAVAVFKLSEYGDAAPAVTAPVARPAAVVKALPVKKQSSTATAVTGARRLKVAGGGHDEWQEF